jgi:hypothetical protein
VSRYRGGSAVALEEIARSLPWRAIDRASASSTSMPRGAIESHS